MGQKCNETRRTRFEIIDNSIQSGGDGAVMRLGRRVCRPHIRQCHPKGACTGDTPFMAGDLLALSLKLDQGRVYSHRVLTF
mgnify:CR=1 FL=1